MFKQIGQTLKWDTREGKIYTVKAFVAGALVFGFILFFFSILEAISGTAQ